MLSSCHVARSDLYAALQYIKQRELPEDSPFGQVRKELPTFEATPFGMKCRFPVTEIHGVTIAVFLRHTTTEWLGLLLHPAPAHQVLDSSRDLYYVSWAFYDVNEDTCSWAKRVAFLGDDLYNLRFDGKPINPRWREVCIVTRPPMIVRRSGAHIVHLFPLDFPPTIFRVPRTLLQAMTALNLLPRSQTVSSDPESTQTTRLMFENVVPLEVVYIVLGACANASTAARPCHHWAWAEHRHRATWGSLSTSYVHDCTNDHIEAWPDRIRDFGDEERTIRLVFAPCTHAPERTLVLGLELVGSVYEKIQRDADLYLLPPSSLPLRNVDASEPDDVGTMDLTTISPPSTGTEKSWIRYRSS